MATSEVIPQAPQHSPAGKTAVAPAWHTALGIAAMVGVAVMTGMQAGKMQNAAQHPMAIYLPTIAWENGTS